jgi:hypothetical protein
MRSQRDATSTLMSCDQLDVDLVGETGIRSEVAVSESAGYPQDG